MRSARSWQVAADVTIRPTSGLVLAAPAATALGHEPAFILLVGGVGAAHWSGRIRAARGRSFATGSATTHGLINK
jgi:hypothetical protein